MKYKNKADQIEMLEWEKVNAVEHVRKANTAEQEKLDSRVVVIEDRCFLSDMFFYYIHILYRNILQGPPFVAKKFKVIYVTLCFVLTMC